MRTSKVISVIATALFGLAFSSVAALAVPATAKSAVNVRTGPGISFARIDTLFAGEAVNITQCQGGWCYVEHPGPDGWVSGNYLIATGGGGSASGSTSNSGDVAAAAVIGAILGAIAGSSASTPPAPPPPAPLPYGPDTCKQGFVWRDAIPGDHVCVTPARRTAAANENAVAGARVNPTGAYGPNTCRVGFVWREAYAGDVVCVTPTRRTQVRNENLRGPNNRAVAP